MVSKRIEPWMIRNLNTYRNCIIGEDKLKRLGRKSILEELKNQGIEARIISSSAVEVSEFNSTGEFIQNRKKEEITYIIEVI